MLPLKTLLGFEFKLFRDILS